MASSNTAWGIEIGQYAIKAIQLESHGSGVRVRDFAVIKHEFVLTDPALIVDGQQGAGADRASSIIEMSLNQLATQKKLDGKNVVVSFSWMQNRGFARFSILPPIDTPKQIHGLVKYEAEQQIPFKLDDVEWDFHAFTSNDDPTVDVGIFAIQSEPLEAFLALVSDKLGIAPQAVTLAPVALYNALVFDLDIVSNGETAVFLDIGTSATDLIIADGERCWMRSFPLGGHEFTEAIANEFKLPYRKADDLKQKSATSENAKQIMAAMRPVIGDLLGDVQKSIQFYSSQHNGVKLVNVVGLGSTLKIPGLRKWLGMQLNLEVERLKDFRKISVEGPESAEFEKYIVNFGVAYGLALQGLGLSAVSVNLLPRAKMRQQIWNRKTRWFAGAAAIACAAGGLMFLRGILDNSVLSDVSAVTNAERAVTKAKGFQDELANQAANIGSLSKNMIALLEDREVWPLIVNDAVTAVAQGNDATAIGSDPKKLLTPDDARKQTVLRDLSGVYKLDKSGARVIEVTMNVEFNSGAVPSTDHLKDTINASLTETASRVGAPYAISNIKWSSSRMKVGPDGSLTADASATSPTDAASGAATGVEGGNFSAAGASFNAGGSGGENQNMGGVSGKRTGGTGNVKRPGGQLSGAGAGGGFDTGSARDPNDAAAGSSTKPPEFSRGTGSGETPAGPSIDLDKLAPIPSRPGIFPPDTYVYVGKITFDVKLAGEIAAAASAEPTAEGQ